MILPSPSPILPISSPSLPPLQGQGALGGPSPAMLACREGPVALCILQHR